MADVARRESGISQGIQSVDRPRGISRRKIIFGLLATGALAAGGKLVYDQLNKDTPIVYDYYDPKSFKPQVVDTTQATPEQIREFMDRRLPEFKNPDSGKNAPSIEILAPFDARISKTITVTKRYSVNERMPDPDRYYSFSTEISISGEDVPFYLPLIEGANKVDAKRRLEAHTSTIVLRYHLNDGRFLTGYITSLGVEGGDWEKFKLTETAKNLPAFDTSITKNTPQDSMPTIQFDLTQRPTIDLIHSSGSVIFSLIFYNESPSSGPTKYFPLNASFKANDGKLLSTTPPK